MELHLAAARGDAKRLQVLLDSGRVHVDCKDKVSNIYASSKCTHTHYPHFNSCNWHFPLDRLIQPTMGSISRRWRRRERDTSLSSGAITWMMHWISIVRFFFIITLSMNDDRLLRVWRRDEGLLKVSRAEIRFDLVYIYSCSSAKWKTGCDKSKHQNRIQTGKSDVLMYIFERHRCIRNSLLSKFRL